jgi:hypothetical protein
MRCARLGSAVLRSETLEVQVVPFPRKGEKGALKAHEHRGGGTVHIFDRTGDVEHEIEGAIPVHRVLEKVGQGLIASSPANCTINDCS